MAGAVIAAALSTTTTNNLQSEASTQNSHLLVVIDQWQVQYARFINHNSSSFRSTNRHPSLAPARKNTWISASGAASLRLNHHLSSDGHDDTVLVLSLGSRVIEEHYISKMHFSWPHVSCVSWFPARGTKAVFVSYKDCVGQIQKFALRFSAIHETEKFMDLLKEILKSGTPQQIQCSEFNPELSSQAEVIPCDGPTCRIEDNWNYMASANNSTQLMLPSYELSAAQDSVSQERIMDDEATETMSQFPPSFTQLVKSHAPAVAEAKPMGPHPDLKTQFVRYLQESSFKELLATVENVIGELGDGFVL